VIRTELHESTMSGSGERGMQMLDRVEIPARGTVTFKQGGKHAMVWGTNRIARRLGKLNAIFLFSNGDRIMVSVPVINMDGSQTKEYEQHH
jgi:periplasmic copper chaperone A